MYDPIYTYEMSALSKSRETKSSLVVFYSWGLTGSGGDWAGAASRSGVSFEVGMKMFYDYGKTAQFYTKSHSVKL